MRRPTCTTPARPTFRTPPCARHPACGTAHARHPKDGVRRGRARGTARGRAHMQWGEGRGFRSAPPASRVALVVVGGPIGAHGVGRKGEGRGQLRVERLRGSPARKSRGACDAPPILATPPILTRSRAPPGPCSSGGAFSPPCSHRQGGAEGRRRTLRSLSCSAEREGAYLLRAALHSPFAHRGGVALTPRAKGGENRAPPLSVRGKWGRQGGAHRRGPCGKRGRGMQTVCLHPPPPLYLFVSHVARRGRGGADSRCRE